jgi:hypothetical protein
VSQRDSKGFLAVVSPCSQCKTQRAYPEKDGKQTYCPRRRWIEEIKKKQAADEDVSGFQHLVLTGKEGKTSGSSGAANDLLNPVIDRTNKSILVWVARLIDNQAQVDPKSDQVTKPYILDPSFIPDATDDIVCDSFPYLPETDEFTYFSQGTLEEGQLVLLTGTNQQIEVETGATSRIGGTCKRTSLLNSVPSARPKEHHSPEGT